MIRTCICCQKERAFKGYLCGKCRQEYGAYKTWPEWLKFLHEEARIEYRTRVNNPDEKKYYYDPVDGRIVCEQRSTLLDQYAEDGYITLRGCRSSVFALIDGHEPTE